MNHPAMTPTTGAQDRAAERVVDAADARELEMAAAIEALCTRFDPIHPNGEIVTPKTARAWKRLGEISTTLLSG